MPSAADVPIIRYRRAAKGHADASRARQAARAELNSVRLRHGEVSDQLRNVGLDNQKLLDAIDAIERGQVRLRADYQQAVRERTDHGQRLMDRQQELCEAYDRLNVMVGTMRNGEVELRSREEDARFLRLEVSKLEREVCAIGWPFCCPTHVGGYACGCIVGVAAAVIFFSRFPTDSAGEFSDSPVLSAISTDQFPLFSCRCLLLSSAFLCCSTHHAHIVPAQ